MKEFKKNTIMGKFAEFMDKILADEAAKAEFEAVIGARKERELSDEDFQKIVELSEKLGAAVTLDEVKDFFTGNGRELSEKELAESVGGTPGDFCIYQTYTGEDDDVIPLVWFTKRTTFTYRCKNCGKTKTLTASESPYSSLEHDCPADEEWGVHEYERIE